MKDLTQKCTIWQVGANQTDVWQLQVWKRSETTTCRLIDEVLKEINSRTDPSLKTEFGKEEMR
jgi:hypothetical protein